MESRKTFLLQRHHKLSVSKCSEVHCGQCNWHSSLTAWPAFCAIILKNCFDLPERLLDAPILQEKLAEVVFLFLQA